MIFVWILAGFGFVALLGASFVAGETFATNNIFTVIVDLMKKNGATNEEMKRFLELIEGNK